VSRTLVDTDSGLTPGNDPSAKRSGPPRAAARRSIDLSRTVAAAAELLESGDRAHAGVATDARDLLITEIEPDPLQPRKHFDTTELKSLSDDIARRGVLQPVLVRPPLGPGEKYRLVAGERRWRAADLAGKVRIPARIRDLSDEDVRAAQLAENVLRAGLSDIEKGRALRGLYELRKAQNPKSTWEDIAGEVGLGRARIHDLFHLASLPEPIAALIANGRLSGSHGIALQRAQETLTEETLVDFAVRAARPENRRGGGFGLSVARLREEIAILTASSSLLEGAEGGTEAIRPASSKLSIQIDNFAKNSDSDGSKAAGTSLKPFVRRTLDALTKGHLSADELRMLQSALESISDSANENETNNLTGDDDETES
jgi:ParB/RepB/Spo0J family partition protein